MTEKTEEVYIETEKMEEMLKSFESVEKNEDEENEF